MDFLQPRHNVPHPPDSPLPFLWFGSAPPPRTPALTFVHYSCLLLQSGGSAARIAEDFLGLDQFLKTVRLSPSLSPSAIRGQTPSTGSWEGVEEKLGTTEINMHWVLALRWDVGLGAWTLFYEGRHRPAITLC